MGKVHVHVRGLACFKSVAWLGSGLHTLALLWGVGAVELRTSSLPVVNMPLAREYTCIYVADGSRGAQLGATEYIHICIYVYRAEGDILVIMYA